MLLTFLLRRAEGDGEGEGNRNAFPLRVFFGYESVSESEAAVCYVCMYIHEWVLGSLVRKVVACTCTPILLNT